MDALTSTTSLTAHLARAKLVVDTARAVHPAAPTVQQYVMPAADGNAAAETGEDAEGQRCAASVISGQRCRRPAATGQIMCPGHIAMGTTAPTLR